MKQRFPWFARAVVGFSLVVFAYLLLFYAIEHRRVAKGPWQITFIATNGTPSLVVNQPALGIRNVQIIFGAARIETNLSHTMRFDQARRVPCELPLGRCVFLDTTFLPGTVVLEAFGHQVQLLPRTLTINGREQSWRSDQHIWLGQPPRRE